jgi:hypothetical protein
MPIEDQNMFIFLENPLKIDLQKKSKPLVHEKINFHLSFFFCIPMHVPSLHNSFRIFEPLKT